MVGVTGTGKSTAAEAIAKRTGAFVISSDVVRKRLAGIPPTERRLEGFDSGIYSADFARRTYDTILKQAGEMLASGHSVILDATFIRKSDRLKARELADKAGADYLAIVFRGTRESIEKRLAARSSSSSVSDGRVEILGPQMRQFEQVDEVPESMHVDFDVSQDVEDNVDGLLRALGES
jgi:predicted kinase